MVGEDIVDPQKILSFLKRVKSINLTLEVMHGNVKTKGSIRYVGEYSFEIYCKDSIDISEPFVEVEIPLENKVYHIRTEVLNMRNNVLLLMMPTRIDVWTKRKFPRKNVYGRLYLSISFIKPVEYSSAVIRPEDIPENLRDLKEEIDKDVPDLKRVVSLVIREIEKVAEGYDFVFYKRGMTLPSSALVSMYFKSPLLVENTSNLECYIANYEGFNVITYGDYMRKMSWDENKVIDQIKKLRASFLSQGVKSFMCVPIRIMGDVIGFIFCKSSQKFFTVKDVMYVDALGLIISEAYVKGKVNAVRNAGEILFPIIDIGGGGVRFEVDSIIGKLLKPDDSVRVFFVIEGHKIQAIGRVLRIDTTKSNRKLWVAISFTFISPEDQQFILSFTSR